MLGFQSRHSFPKAVRQMYEEVQVRRGKKSCLHLFKEAKILSCLVPGAGTLGAKQVAEREPRYTFRANLELYFRELVFSSAWMYVQSACLFSALFNFVVPCSCYGTLTGTRNRLQINSFCHGAFHLIVAELCFLFVWHSESGWLTQRFPCCWCFPATPGKPSGR